MPHITTARALSKNKKNLEKSRRVSRKKKKETCINQSHMRETLDTAKRKQKGNREISFPSNVIFYGSFPSFQEKYSG